MSNFVGLYWQSSHTTSSFFFQFFFNFFFQSQPKKGMPGQSTAALNILSFQRSWCQLVAVSLKKTDPPWWPGVSGTWENTWTTTLRNVQQTTSALNIWPFQRSCYHLLMAYLNKSVPNLCLVEEIKRVNNPLTVTYSRFSASGETCSSSKSAFVIKNSSFTLSSLLHLTVHLKYICDPK